MHSKDHWEKVYSTKAADDVSWFQPHADMSMRLIHDGGLSKGAAIIDVGGGASTLVDDLLNEGYGNITVLDLSGAALETSRSRLGPLADGVQWMEADITHAEFEPHSLDLWHDRAVFHFLTDKADRQKYVETMKRTLIPEGHVVIATFAIDGPEKCSGLDVCRYDAPAMSAELGAEFQLLEQVNETHVTPWSMEQRFSYFRFARRGSDSK